jgi:MHS family proline/betaine transporter-like MFS transporter
VRPPHDRAGPQTSRRRDRDAHRPEIAMTLSGPTAAATPPAAPELRHRIMAGFIGNVVEWYDFALYGYLAGVIAPIFFPAQDRMAGLIATYGIFAAGFLMRPLGAALFGWFGDRYGRARTMQISVVMMAMPTLLLGLLPSYATAGVLAPALLVAIRLLQGLSVGGEFSSSATYLVETAPQDRRGVTGSWANIGSMVGSLLGVGAAALVTNLVDADTLTDWAWRLPFVGGGLIGATAILIRRNLHESERFEQHHAGRDETSPLLEAFTTNRRETLLALAFAASYGTCFYVAFVYLPEWLTGEGLMDRGRALAVNTAMTILVIPLMPLTAAIGDRWLPRRSWIALALLGVGLAAWPLHAWMLASGGSMASVVAAHALLFALIAVPLGSGPALFVELFPQRDRLSGYSVAFNLGVGVFGGLTPMIATVALMAMPDRSRAPLR